MTDQQARILCALHVCTDVQSRRDGVTVSEISGMTSIEYTVLPSFLNNMIQLGWVRKKRGARRGFLLGKKLEVYQLTKKGKAVYEEMRDGGS